MTYPQELINDCQRFIEEGKLNYTVEELLELTGLDISYNQHITFIPNLPKVEVVRCDNCPLLKSLPQWEKVEVVHCDSCPLLQSLPQWEKVETVWCYNCPLLKSLPQWEKVKWVDCSNCPLLQSLPKWEKVERVWCDNCPLLKSLPKWEKVKWVDCSSCPNLDLTTTQMNNKCMVRYWENGAMIDFGTLLAFLKGEMNALDILRIQNIEVRRTLLGYYPAHKFVEELKPALLERSPMGNEMYLLKLDGIEAKMLRYKCPSSDREYTKFIEDHWACADSAMAFHHGYESVVAYRLDKMQT